jgi:DNA-binding Lrp family transcriptional regulator
MGETTGRRIRELIVAGMIEKFETQTPLLENPYTAYRVRNLEEEHIIKDIPGFEGTLEALRLL